jgi:hypothetical protein
MSLKIFPFSVQTYRVLDSIAPLPQYIVLQIEQLEARKEILDEIVDLEGTVVVAQRDRVDGQTGEFFDHRNQGEQVFFDGKVKFVFIFKVDGNLI